MKNYYTSINLEEGRFVGTVYDSLTNKDLYKTKSYNTQSQVVQDINTFLTTSAPPTTEPRPQTPQSRTIINTVNHLPATGGNTKCCGR
jgi:hypothetical protein